MAKAGNAHHSKTPVEKPVSPKVVWRVVGPASLSFMCHVVLVFLLSFVTWAVGATGDGLVTEFTARILSQSDTASSEGFRFPGSAYLDRPNQAEQEEPVQDLASLLKREPSFQMQPAQLGDTGLTSLAVDRLSRSDVVATCLSGGDSADEFGGLGDRSIAGGGPVGTLWGVGKGQQARSIVYVMDRSGSMSDTMNSLQRELKRAIGSLDADQLFNVIWFNEGKAEEWSPRLRKATMENKRDAFEAINYVIPSGETEPVDAVRQSLGYKPDVVFLLSDGDFGEENQRVINLIRQIPRRKRPIINTILFVYDTSEEGEEVLRTIAMLTRGTFKHVTEQDISHR